VQVLGQRAGVNPDAQRRADLARAIDDLRDLVVPADVARIDAHAMGACVKCLERQRVVEVNVGDHRDRRLPDDR
jgi:hypothetical protein